MCIDAGADSDRSMRAWKKVMTGTRRYFTTKSIAALSGWLAGTDTKQLDRWSIAAAGLLLALAATMAPPGNPALAGHAERIAGHVPAWAAALAALPFACALLFVLALLRPCFRCCRRKGDDDFQLYFEPQRLMPRNSADDGADPGRAADQRRRGDLVVYRSRTPRSRSRADADSGSCCGSHLNFMQRKRNEYLRPFRPRP